MQLQNEPEKITSLEHHGLGRASNAALWSHVCVIIVVVLDYLCLPRHGLKPPNWLTLR